MAFDNFRGKSYILIRVKIFLRILRRWNICICTDIHYGNIRRQVRSTKVYISKLKKFIFFLNSLKRIRGFLGSLLVLICNAGILLAYILGNFVDYTTFPIIFLIFPIVFFIGFIFLPETPQYLFKTGNEMVFALFIQ